MLCVYTREDSGFGSWFSQGREEEGEGREGGWWSLFRGAERIFGAEKNGKSVCIVCTFVLDWILSLKLILRGKEIL